MTTYEEVWEYFEPRFAPGWGDLSVYQSWLPHVLELGKKLEEIDGTYQVCQIKDKFGGLRFYLNYPWDTDDRLTDLIYSYEKLSPTWGSQ